MARPSFTIWDESITSRVDQGFTMTFDNGYQASITWGKTKYGDGQKVAEIAVFQPNGDIENGNVEGWQTPEQVVAIHGKGGRDSKKVLVMMPSPVYYVPMHNTTHNTRANARIAAISAAKGQAAAIKAFGKPVSVQPIGPRPRKGA